MAAALPSLPSLPSLVPSSPPEWPRHRKEATMLAPALLLALALPGPAPVAPAQETPDLVLPYFRLAG